jgi:hypothetical protein
MVLSLYLIDLENFEMTLTLGQQLKSFLKCGCFKSSRFSLKLEHGDVSVVSKVSKTETLQKNLKGFYAKLHPGQAEIFRKYAYNSLLEDKDKDIYVMYGPLSYVNHSCSAMIRLAPPDKDN